MPNYYINQAISSLQDALVEIEKISFKLQQMAVAISLSEKYKISADSMEELIRLVTDWAIEEFKRENKLGDDAIICGNIVDGFYYSEDQYFFD